MNYSGLSFRVKLLGGFMAVVLIFIAAAAFQVSGMRRLGRLHDEGSSRSKDAISVENIQVRFQGIYPVIADAIINRNQDESRKEFSEVKTISQKDISELNNIVDTEEERKLAGEFASLYGKYLEYGSRILDELEKGQAADGEKLKSLDDEADKVRDDASNILVRIVDSIHKENEEADREFDRVSHTTNLFSLIISVGGVMLALLISFLITRNTLGQLGADPAVISEVSERISNGELSVSFASGTTRGVYGSMEKMAENLKSSMQRVQMASDQIAGASEELSATAEQMAKGMENQSAQTSQVASAMEEMSATVLQVAKNAQSAASSAKEATTTAQKGGEVVEMTVKGMQKIADTVHESAKTIEELGKSSDQIGEIVAVINDIADQTNLLALNAAIEAARAGEQGRGFAVVADEVRKLAERTSKATKEIEVMIKNIQKETKGAVAAMEAGTNEVAEGVKLANEAGRALNMIVDAVDRVNDMIGQIATASEEQSSAAEEISSSIEGIASVTKETADGSRQTSSASHELSRMATELRSIVGQFKV